MAEAVWSCKLRDQEILDHLHVMDLGGLGASLTFGLVGQHKHRRTSELARRVANATALRRALYARYPSVGLTSLEAMKTARNDNTALAVLEAYARSLTRTAAGLRERVRDVVYAHHAARGDPCPLDGPRPQTPDFARRMMHGARLATEWAYDVSRTARLETQAWADYALGNVGLSSKDVGGMACCRRTCGVQQLQHQL